MKRPNERQTLQKSGKVYIMLALVTAGVSCNAQIQLNQVGFYPSVPKMAIVANNTGATDFSICDARKKNVVFSGKLSAEKQSHYSSIKTKTADFSAFTKPGTYVIRVAGLTDSYVFEIKPDALHAVATSVLKGFYFMRSNIPLTEQYAGKWHRAAGHPDTSVLVHASAASAQRPQGTVLSTPGGWYDAGDYNKYIVNSGITMGTLLSAYEDFPHYFDRMQTNIPESGDKIPDLLNEVIYNLRWMMTMQDPNDGGVYHKCTNAAFDAFVMPGVTKAPRYVVQKGTGATLDFAAVTAQAARILKNFDRQLPGLADSCLRASKYAWQWALKNPALVYSQRDINSKYDPDITTGEYGDRSFTDEWLWAAAELYISTKEATYQSVLQQRAQDLVMLPSWANVAMMGYYSLVRHEKNLGLLSPMVAQAKTRIRTIADEYLAKQPDNAFGTVMGQSARDFNWGSNSVAANQGMLLIYAYLLFKDRKYLNGALSNADYLLGRNATGYCFITGSGTKSTLHPHHRPSSADGVAEPVPGLVAGGPNPGRQDHCTYPFLETELSYADEECSYASNEIAINWNAPVVYLLNALEALNK